MTGKPPLTDNDKQSWSSWTETTDLRLLHSPKIKPSLPAAGIMQRRMARKNEQSDLPADQVFYAPSIPVTNGFLECGDLSAMDRMTARKLQKGLYPIDATIDLHGFTQDNAHRHLIRFLHKNFQQQTRCLLIITGKGKSLDEPGLLRKSLPNWLNQPDIRSLVVAYCTAAPTHGGYGAFYLLLRKHRA